MSDVSTIRMTVDHFAELGQQVRWRTRRRALITYLSGEVAPSGRPVHRRDGSCPVLDGGRSLTAHRLDGLRQRPARSGNSAIRSRTRLAHAGEDRLLAGEHPLRHEPSGQPTSGSSGYGAESGAGLPWSRCTAWGRRPCGPSSTRWRPEAWARMGEQRAIRPLAIADALREFERRDPTADPRVDLVLRRGGALRRGSATAHVISGGAQTP